MRVTALIAALIAGVAVASPVQAQSVKAGIEAWQRSDHAAAVAIWRPLAEAGDADAAFNLGQAYRLGRGVELDLAAAQMWLEQAARDNHVDAQTTLGLLLFQNGNRISGLRWLKMAADAGDARALLIYGTALFNGDGIAQDPVLAYAYVSRAAAQGLAPAKATLAEMDKILPLDQRKKGVAIALEKAKAKPPAAKAATANSTKVASKPAAPRKAQAKPAAAAFGHWRIQLGAFSKRSSAEALYKKLSGTAPVAGHQPSFVAAGAVTRLQVGPFESKAAAAAACKALSAKGNPCFVVPSK